MRRADSEDGKCLSAFRTLHPQHIGFNAKTAQVAGSSSNLVSSGASKPSTQASDDAFETVDEKIVCVQTNVPPPSDSSAGQLFESREEVCNHKEGAKTERSKPAS